jgi:hypothetical protein
MLQTRSIDGNWQDVRSSQIDFLFWAASCAMLTSQRCARSHIESGCVVWVDDWGGVFIRLK